MFCSLTPDHDNHDNHDNRDDRDARGASLIEYALLLGLIAMVCITAIAFFGGRLSTSMSHNGSAVASAGS